MSGFRIELGIDGQPHLVQTHPLSDRKDDWGIVPSKTIKKIDTGKPGEVYLPVVTLSVGELEKAGMPNPYEGWKDPPTCTSELRVPVKWFPKGPVIERLRELKKENKGPA